MIRIEGLTKQFGTLEVLGGLDLEIAPGRVTAILGPNAAGKSTLIKCILGLVRPDGGDIWVGTTKLNGSWRYREQIGYMSQEGRFPENLTTREVIDLIVDLRASDSTPGPTSSTPSDTSSGTESGTPLDRELIPAFDLEPEMDKRVGHLSGGTRQKLAAVLAFLFAPDILILDEPTAGLDPVASSRLKDKIGRVRDEGRTVLLTSHLMSEVDELADHLVFLQEGTIRFEGSPEELKSRTGEALLERAIAHTLTHDGPEVPA